MIPLQNPKVGDLVFWKQDTSSRMTNEPDDYMFVYEVEPEFEGETYFLCWSMTFGHNVGGVVLNNDNKSNWWLVQRLEE